MRFWLNNVKPLNFTSVNEAKYLNIGSTKIILWEKKNQEAIYMQE